MMAPRALELELLEGHEGGTSSSSSSSSSSPAQRGAVRFAFETCETRDAVFRALAERAELRAVARCEENEERLADATAAWRARRMDNYTYLALLNRFADRSLLDLSQYPVFPWVLADYDSEHLDLTDPASFRDLSQPIGALCVKRLLAFTQRFEV